MLRGHVRFGHEAIVARHPITLDDFGGLAEELSDSRQFTRHRTQTDVDCQGKADGLCVDANVIAFHDTGFLKAPQSLGRARAGESDARSKLLERPPAVFRKRLKNRTVESVRALVDFARRDDVVIASKIFHPVGSGPNGGGLSRKAIFTGIDASLRRLKTDYLDLCQIHRWDDETPIEEPLEALHDLVKSGKVRYLGASSRLAWQFCKALHLADRHGWTRFVSMQPHYNLLNREEEREMLPLCRSEGIGVLPWSPLARGRLARAWQEPSSTDRIGTTRPRRASTPGRTRQTGKWSMPWVTRPRVLA